MKIKIVMSIIFLFLLLPIFSNISIADTLEDEVYFKSIISLSFTPKNDMEFKNFQLPSGMLYQSGSKPEEFRNQLLLLEEIESISTLQLMWISGFRENRLTDAHNKLFFKNFSRDQVLYPRRWSFFIIGAKSASSPPSPMFGDSEASWVNYGNGFYYVNYSNRCVAIWTWYPGNFNNIAIFLLKTVNATFPFYEWNYLEHNFYLKSYIDFCENCLKNISSIDENSLNIYYEEINNMIFDCIKRKNQYYQEYFNLANASTYFYFITSSFGIVKPLKDEVDDIIDASIEQNNRNLENLQQTKGIIQGELNKRLQESEIQRDYILTFLAVFFGAIVGGFFTLRVNLYLQKKERVTYYASNQRIKIYEPLYNEINQIVIDLNEFKCPFNNKETIKIYNQFEPSDKNRIPQNIREKIDIIDEKARAYYDLYIESLDILQREIDNVMKRYKLRGITRGVVDNESISIQNTFRGRKIGFFQEYRNDIFLGELHDMSGRPSFRRLREMLNNASITEEYIFNRILSEIEPNQTIIDLRNIKNDLITSLNEFKTLLEVKINYIFNKYESKLKEI